MGYGLGEMKNSFWFLLFEIVFLVDWSSLLDNIDGYDGEGMMVDTS